MLTRNREHFVKQDAVATIVYECIRYKKSSGWSCNDTKEFESVKKDCQKYGIEYTNDWFGEFELKN